MDSLINPELMTQLSEGAQAMGLKLLAALATFIIGRWIAKIIVAGIKKALMRGKADPTLAGFLGNVAYGLLMAVVVIAALGELGVSTTSAAALLGGAGVAIGLSLKDQLSSFAAGVMLIMFRPFRVGETIKYDESIATVEKIGLKSTHLRSVNGELLVISNTNLLSKEITNYAHLDRRRVQFGIADPVVGDRMIGGDQRVQRVGDRLLVQTGLGPVEIQPRPLGTHLAAGDRGGDDRRQQMQAGMQAHMGVAPVPVEHHGQEQTRRRRCLGTLRGQPVGDGIGGRALDRFGHNPRPPVFGDQPATVAGLTAAGRIEHRPVQDDGAVIGCRQHGRGAVAGIGLGAEDGLGCGQAVAGHERAGSGFL